MVSFKRNTFLISRKSCNKHLHYRCAARFQNRFLLILSQFSPLVRIHHLTERHKRLRAIACVLGPVLCTTWTLLQNVSYSQVLGAAAAPNKWEVMSRAGVRVQLISIRRPLRLPSREGLIAQKDETTSRPGPGQAGTASLAQASPLLVIAREGVFLVVKVLLRE
jgi:hypothetical protein